MSLVIHYHVNLQAQSRFKKRGVAPVIAHLLLVAIAVIGGTIIFTFSEGFFSSAQISGSQMVESLTIHGFDARAVPNLQMHDGNNMQATSGFTPNVNFDDRIAIYVTNNSVEKVVLGEVKFGGFEYSYVNAAALGLGAYDTTTVGQLRVTNYTVLTSTSGGTIDGLLNEDAGEIKAGQTVTILLDLESDLRVGRSTQLKMTTSNGNVFVGTISVGQQRG